MIPSCTDRVELVDTRLGAHLGEVRPALEGMLAAFARFFGILPPALPPEAPRQVARETALRAIAGYWSQHPAPGRQAYRLPRIVWWGAPWAVGPEAIHVFDLKENALRRALEANLSSAPTLFQLQAQAVASPSPELVLDLLLGTARMVIEADWETAWTCDTLVR